MPRAKQPSGSVLTLGKKKYAFVNQPQRTTINKNTATMKTNQIARLIISITDKYQGEIARKGVLLTSNTTRLPIDTSEVIFADWLPSGCYADVTVQVDESEIYTERKLIPNTSGIHELADLAGDLLGKQMIKHKCDVWAAWRLNENGEGRVKVHIGIPGKHTNKAKFRCALNLQAEA